MTSKYTVCPKCRKVSGDDWSQCENSCPMPMSPYYDEHLRNNICIKENYSYDLDPDEYFEFLGKCIEEDDLYYKENLFKH